MTPDSLARYYGPCDVRIDAFVMRLECYLQPGTGPVRGYVDNRYDVPLADIARREVTLCLPGGATIPVRAGDILLRNGEPIGWPVEQCDPSPARPGHHRAQQPASAHVRGRPAGTGCGLVSIEGGFNIIRWEPAAACCEGDVNSRSAAHATGCTAGQRPQLGVFVQWKGTDACIDFTCVCGRVGHYDGMFAYTLRCSCGRLWRMPAQFMLLETGDDDGCIQDLDMECDRP